jgi:hypothetical protein
MRTHYITCSALAVLSGFVGVASLVEPPACPAGWRLGVAVAVVWRGLLAQLDRQQYGLRILHWLPDDAVSGTSHAA